MKRFTFLKGALMTAAMLFVGSMSAQVVLSETFEGFAKGSPNAEADSKDVAADLDTYTQTPGWTGLLVYQAGGTAKMGGGSKLGSITTPAINLSDASATYTLAFKACAWANAKEATTLKVFVDDQLVYTAENLNKTDYTFTPYSTPITGTATSKVRFEGAQATNGRFFLDDLVITRTGGGQVLPPAVIVPAKVDFPSLKVGQTKDMTVSLSASDLTADLTVVVVGEGFSTQVATISKADAQAGTTVSVTFAPTAVKAYEGTMTVSGGGLAEAKVVALNGKGINLTGTGTAESPFTVADVIALDNTDPGTYYVKGYIVGAIVYKAPSEFEAPFSTNTALYMGDIATERDTTLLVPVQLTTKPVDVRTELNLKDHPENLGKALTIQGELGAYFGMPGIKNPASYLLGSSSIGSVEATDRVFTAGGVLKVNASQAGMVEVYNVVGQKVKSQSASTGVNEINGLASGQIYIVKFAGKTKKVVL